MNNRRRIFIAAVLIIVAVVGAFVLQPQKPAEDSVSRDGKAANGSESGALGETSDESVSVVDAFDEAEGREYPEESDQLAIPLEQSKAVAEKFAERWGDRKAVPAGFACAPDGRREVNMFIVDKQGGATPDLSEHNARLADLREKRRALEEKLRLATEKDDITILKKQIADVWEELAGADRYGTVITGANLHREPFIASYNGLPSHLLLYEDAVRMAKKQLNTEENLEPDFIWLPPLFELFRFEKNGRTLYLEARGHQLHQVQLNEWKRRSIDGNTERQRREKWGKYIGGKVAEQEHSETR